jgi:hypothetical protein
MDIINILLQGKEPENGLVEDRGPPIMFYALKE